MVVISFKKQWIKLKYNLNDEDYNYFINFVNIDNTVGRVSTLSSKQDNPRYNVFWFPVCRCHWAVILPTYLLNNRSNNGKYKILTSDKHSVIINIETNEIFDPTYEFNGISLNNTIYSIGNINKIIPLDIHLKELGYY